MNLENLKTKIVQRIDNPDALEELYRSSKNQFRSAFFELLPQLEKGPLTSFWQARLTHETDEIAWGSKKEWLLISILVLVTNLIAKFPSFFEWDEEFFYPRNFGFLALGGTSIYHLWINGWNRTSVLPVVSVFLLSMIYVHVLPHNPNSATLTLAFIHLPLLLMAATAISFGREHPCSGQNRLDFLRFLGDWAVITAILLLAGGIMTGLTIGLFTIIGVEIEEFYFRNVVVFLLPSVPLAGTFLINNNPHLVSKVSPIIAHIFSPAILIILLVYLGAIFMAGQDLYLDREFLLLFNLLIIGVMALLFFSLAENSSGQPSGFRLTILSILSTLTVIVSAIALSAIVFRLSTWGISANRLAVMGANVLMLIHLIIISIVLWKTVVRKATLKQMEMAVVKYLPVYIIWIMIVVFLFPLFFGFA